VVWVLKLGVNLELNVVNGMAGTSMPVNGLHLVSVRCLVTGKNAELKRLDGMSEKPGLLASRAFMRDASGKTRFKQGMFKTKSVD
jgi:hypothetical protein